MEEEFAEFIQKVDENAVKVKEYIFEHKPDLISEVDIKESVLHYIGLKGKRLRPYGVLIACGAVGGDPSKSLPLQAAVEVFHTWTLVHDDIIDEDDQRRGDETVHYRWSRIARDSYGYSRDRANLYGLAIGLLAGDLQQGWSMWGLLSLLRNEKGISSDLAFDLGIELGWNTLQTLVNGETKDVRYSLVDLKDAKEKNILDIMYEKTGVLYRYCGMAGAMIGLNTRDTENALVKKLTNFAKQSGIAFQIQDDILGLYGNEEELGKPVGSDVREGKRTLAVLYAFKNAKTNSQRKLFKEVLGNVNATKKQISEFTAMIEELGGRDYAKQYAKAYIEGGTVNGHHIIGAQEYLDGIPETDYKDQLYKWSNYLIGRTH
jgi:geranylgeranyl diphosphate synthase type I